MIPLAKNIKRYFSLKEVAIVLIAVVVSVSAGVGVYLSLKKDVVITDNGKQFVIKTMKTTVQEVLEQKGISVQPYDYINLPLDTKLQRIRDNEIYIKRAVPVNVFVDGQIKKLMTYKDTVKDALENSKLENCKFDFSNGDKLDGVEPDDKIVSGMDIKVIRVKQDVVKEEISIPFRVVTRDNSNLNKGVSKTVVEGKDGLREKAYQVVYEDGKAVSKKLIADNIVKNPIDKIIENGTVANHITSRGQTLRYSKVLDMRATSYTASYADTGKHPGDPEFGITYTGIRAKKGVIAVDPKVIPLGTKVYVEVAGETPDYGYAVAADIGGAIKGNLIDLYFDESYTVANWGVRKVKVYILLD